MKRPFKIIGLIIIIATIAYAAWPSHSVKDHNPATGEGAPGEGHDHAHLDPAPVLSPEKRESIISDEKSE